MRVKPSNLATTQVKRLIAAGLPAKLGRESEGQKLTLLSETLTIAVAGCAGFAALRLPAHGAALALSYVKRISAAQSGGARRE